MAFFNSNSTWQELKDDYRTYCGIASFSKEDEQDQDYLQWRDS